MSGPLKVEAQLSEIIDLAIKYGAHSTIFIVDGLMTTLYVDNGQAAYA
jgi:hypothetical protein